MDMFYMLSSCGEPVTIDGAVQIFVDEVTAQMALGWYIEDGAQMGFDDSAAKIEQVVLARPMHPVTA